MPRSTGALEPDRGQPSTLDRGALGLDTGHRIVVSDAFTARAEAARRVYDLHGQQLQPRPGTPVSSERHVRWHTTQVFKVPALTA